MTRTTHSYRRLQASLLIGAVVFGLGSIGYAQKSAESAQQQQTFASPEQGVAAFINALRKDDRQALESVLGPDSGSIISSGDPVADKNAKDQFLKDYDAKSSLEVVNDTTRTLEVGPSDWPLPIPLVKRGEAWRFDTEAGRNELLNRRIGRNEENAIQASLAFIDAEREYASQDRNGDGILQYAQLFGSTNGMKDGLYWPVQPGEPQSPLGPFFADAQSEGYFQSVAPGDAGTRRPEPYYGYHYLILTAQGPSAPGGAYDYIVDGKMIGGVALVAYPVEYGVSGVMTFIINHDGVLYQQDLGPETREIAESMTEYDPDSSWQRVQVPTPVASAP